MSLYDQNGQRKYLTPAEREVRTFCSTLARTGCRISEALQLSADRIGPKAGVLIFEKLEKTEERRLPAHAGSPCLSRHIQYGSQPPRGAETEDSGRGFSLWTVARNTARRNVCDVMDAAKIVRPHATPKGLRLVFGIKAITSGVPLNMLQKWLGHPQLSTISIHADAHGAEAHQIANWMWV